MVARTKVARWLSVFTTFSRGFTRKYVATQRFRTSRALASVSELGRQNS